MTEKCFTCIPTLAASFSIWKYQSISYVSTTWKRLECTSSMSVNPFSYSWSHQTTTSQDSRGSTLGGRKTLSCAKNVSHPGRTWCPTPSRGHSRSFSHPVTQELCQTPEILPGLYLLLFVLRKSTASLSLLTACLTMVHFEEVFKCYEMCSISRVIFAADV